nr:galactosyl transferase [uncultured Albidiferax sp.]
MLTFIIPVRHQDNSKNWADLKKNLVETIKSVTAQKNNEWRAVIIANHGADIPDLPPQFEVHRVNFPPNPNHEKKDSKLDAFYEAVRMDKGRRILAGLIYARPKGHIMMLDDDDFVSNRLSTHVSENSTANGWYFDEGYVWPDGGRMLYRYNGFNKYCGSSHIVRADLLKIPKSLEEASNEYISRTLGSHISINDDLKKSGSPLQPLPFVGAVYRTAHPESHSKSNGLFRQFVLNKRNLKNPYLFLKNINRFRTMTESIKSEFFG